MFHGKNDENLTKLQVRFVDLHVANIIKTGKENWSKSAREAGYSEKSIPATISNLKRNVLVRKAISDRMKLVVDSVNVSPDFVLKGLVENYKRAMQIIPVTDKHGKKIGVFKWDGKVANRSLELIGKILGICTDTVIDRTSSHYAEEMKNLFKRAMPVDAKIGNNDAECNLIAEATKKVDSKKVFIKTEEVYEEIESAPETVFDNEEQVK